MPKAESGRFRVIAEGDGVVILQATVD